MKPKPEQAIGRSINQVCGKIRQILPEAVKMAGEEFTGEVTIRIPVNCGGVPSKPRIILSF